jgi:hypothetical protein
MLFLVCDALCLRFQGILKTGAVVSSETLVPMYQITMRHFVFPFLENMVCVCVCDCETERSKCFVAFRVFGTNLTWVVIVKRATLTYEFVGLMVNISFHSFVLFSSLFYKALTSLY